MLRGNAGGQGALIASPLACCDNSTNDTVGTPLLGVADSVILDLRKVEDLAHFSGCLDGKEMDGAEHEQSMSADTAKVLSTRAGRVFCCALSGS